MKTEYQYTVTAVITTHNRRKLLERAIQSVLVQNYDGLDLVVVDDASTDDTQSYMTNLAQKDSRISYIRIAPEETHGANPARNVGILAAKGELIAFLDDDDVWLPEKTNEQTAFFRRHPSADAVSCDWFDVYRFGKREYQYQKHYSFKRGKNEFFIVSYMSSTSGIMIRKSALERIGGFDEDLPDLHEVELAYRICMHSKVGFLKKPLYRYYHYMDGKSISCKADNYIEALRIVNEKYVVSLSQLTTDQKRRYDAVGIKEIAYRHLKSGDKATYRRKIGPYLKQYGIKEAAVYYGSYFLDYNTFMKAKIVIKNLREKL